MNHLYSSFMGDEDRTVNFVGVSDFDVASRVVTFSEGNVEKSGLDCVVFEILVTSNAVGLSLDSNELLLVVPLDSDGFAVVVFDSVGRPLVVPSD